MLLEIRKKLAATASACEKKPPEPKLKIKPEVEKLEEPKEEPELETVEIPSPMIVERTVEKRSTSIDERLKEQFNLLKEDEATPKKRRAGLVEEIIISVSIVFILGILKRLAFFSQELKRTNSNLKKI